MTPLALSIIQQHCISPIDPENIDNSIQKDICNQFCRDGVLRSVEAHEVFEHEGYAHPHFQITEKGKVWFTGIMDAVSRVPLPEYTVPSGEHRLGLGRKELGLDDIFSPLRPGGKFTAPGFGDVHHDGIAVADVAEEYHSPFKPPKNFPEVEMSEGGLNADEVVDYKVELEKATDVLVALLFSLKLLRPSMLHLMLPRAVVECLNEMQNIIESWETGNA